MLPLPRPSQELFQIKQTYTKKFYELVIFIYMSYFSWHLHLKINAIINTDRNLVPFLGGEFGAHPKSNMPQPCYSSCPYILLECVKCTPLSEWEDIFKLSTLIWISAMPFWTRLKQECEVFDTRSIPEETC